MTGFLQQGMKFSNICVKISTGVGNIIEREQGVGEHVWKDSERLVPIPVAAPGRHQALPLHDFLI
jgi:hypothetical protein